MGSDNGLVSNRQIAVTWTNDDLVNERILTSLDLSELKLWSRNNTENKNCQFDNSVVTGGTVSCHYDNLRCHQSQQSCQIDDLLFSLKIIDNTFADIYSCILLNMKLCIFMLILISVKFIFKGTIDNKWTLFQNRHQAIAWANDDPFHYSPPDLSGLNCDMTWHLTF